MIRTRICLITAALWVCPSLAGAASSPQPDADPRIRALIAAVSEDRLRALATTLAGFTTRHTMSGGGPAGSGIAAARQWIHDELKRSSSRLDVSFDTYRLPPQGRITHETEIRNVMAVLPGRTSRRVYVSGHYDSINLGAGVQMASARRGADAARVADPQTQAGFDYAAPAPGANDDGSGTVLTMELARIFGESGIAFDATLVFICWAGEEQGSFGARAHAEALQAAKGVVEAMFSNDIVGNAHGGDGVVDGASVRVYSAGPEDSPSRALARYVARVADVYVPSQRVRLMAREDRFGRGSDHQGFRQAGYPALVFREAREDFSRQHGAGDTVEGMDFGYLARNARVNAAAAASLALAPPAPVVTGERGQPLISRDPSGYDAHLRWGRVSGAAGYRIYWRDTWSNDWQHAQGVGDVTDFVLPDVSIDDVVFGIAAVGPGGEESVVSAYVPPITRDAPVQVVK